MMVPNRNVHNTTTGDNSNSNNDMTDDTAAVFQLSLSSTSGDGGGNGTGGDDAGFGDTTTTTDNNNKMFYSSAKSLTLNDVLEGGRGEGEGSSSNHMNRNKNKNAYRNDDLSNDGSTYARGHHDEEYETTLAGRYDDDDDDDDYSVNSSGSFSVKSGSGGGNRGGGDGDIEAQNSKSKSNKNSNNHQDVIISQEETMKVDKIQRSMMLLLLFTLCSMIVSVIVNIVTIVQRRRQQRADCIDDFEEDEDEIDDCNESTTANLSGDVFQLVLSLIMLGIMVLTMTIFKRYNDVVQERHDNLLHVAQRASAVVSSLFPKAVQNRIMADVEEKNNAAAAAAVFSKSHGHLSASTSIISGGDNCRKMLAQQHVIPEQRQEESNNTLSPPSSPTKGTTKKTRRPSLGMSSFSNLTSPQLKRKLLGDGKTNFSSPSAATTTTTMGSRRRILQGGNDEERGEINNFLKEESEFHHCQTTMSKPIADLFPEATIIFADLVGFTAWSSMREPSQVFTLLESIYHEFDNIARRRKVFKVETVGDCYVAVCGLPEPNSKHAVAVARFASECRQSMNDLVKDLEVTLGPDTADLRIRVGLHSGPVTAGVLRGDKARFQLFGDTVNTTSRLETTGKPDKIHVSQETAAYLIAAGKEHWLTLREDKVSAKGKGELTTYWLKITAAGRRHSITPSTLSDEGTGEISSENEDAPSVQGLSEKQERLVHWITNELAVLLKEIEVGRVGAGAILPDNIGKPQFPSASIRKLENETYMHEGRVPLDDVEEIITLPNFDESASENYDDMNLLRQSYELPHKVLSELHLYVHALACIHRNNPFHSFEHASHVTMSVVKLLSRIVAPDINYDDDDAASKLHEFTFGITSDPLTQFAVVLSALIHDVDHPGVSNGQLMKEDERMARRYNNRSIAEQNSVDMAWRLLMDDDFKHLRGAIYHTETEFKRFRKLVVNTVLATDIMDKELGARRKDRWTKAFSDDVHEDKTTAINRKATIVLEHLIQASDVAHTMQHWHIYRKWNSRLFAEMYKAFVEGRAETNPADFWYEGELSFYDFYIIPLALKLKDCGVFGVSSDEYLNYAQQNRREWELNGKRVVSEMVAESEKLNRSEAQKQTSTPASIPKRNSNPKLCLKDLAGEIGQGPKLVVESRIFKRKSERISAQLTKLPETMSILVVDDDKITRKMFTRSVKKVAPKWHVQDAESGETALELLFETETKFDLIFMDHYMGTSSEQLLGSDTVIELRKRGIECVVCGMSANDVEHLFESAGADEFIFKPLPFREEALKRELLRILSTGDGWGF